MRPIDIFVGNDDDFVFAGNARCLRGL